MQPLSLTACDTSNIGENGLFIDGYTPSVFIKKSKDNNNDNNDDFNYNDYIADEYDDSNEKDNNHNTNHEHDNIFTKVRAIISFDSKDLLCQWMDTIEEYSLENKNKY